jgi:hypothetical protein
MAFSCGCIIIRVKTFGGRFMKGSCDTCAYYYFDEEYDDYICDMDIDEDDYARLMERDFKECPYYTNGDEYKVVRHQM